MTTDQIIKLIIDANYSLNKIYDFHQSGVSFKLLNDDPHGRDAISQLVRRNFGNGINILIGIGLDLTKKDSKGSTPLFYIVSEGLCGATKKLIPLYSTETLHEKNNSGLTILSLLIARAHIKCNCMSLLKDRSLFKSFVLFNNLYDILRQCKSDDCTRVEIMLEYWISNNFFDHSIAMEDDYFNEMNEFHRKMLQENKNLSRRLIRIGQLKNHEDKVNRYPIALYYQVIRRIRHIFYAIALEKNLSANCFNEYQIGTLPIPNDLKNAIKFVV